jgi:extracellular elastinolytic metalloproteinase
LKPDNEWVGAGYSLVSGWSRAALAATAACLLAAAAGAGAAHAADPGSHDVLRPAGQERALARAEARREFRNRTGRFALLAVDPATATPRAIGRLDGFLTGPSKAAGRDVAFGYVRARPELFGLDAGDLTALELVRHYTAGGIEQLAWAQTYEGIPAIDTSLTANLTEDGRLINLLGGPRPDLAVSSIEPAVGATAAYASAARALDGRSSRASGRGAGPEQATEFANGDTATLVIYEGRVAPRLGWRLLVHVDDLHVYDAVVDATTGTLVRHQNLVSDVVTGKVFKNYPGAPVGGTQEQLTLDPYLDTPMSPTRLFGPTAHTFSDTGDTVVTNPYVVPGGANNGEIAPTGGNWNYDFTPFTGCPTNRRCTWDPNTASSWTTNRRPDAVTLHWLVGNFHDHLENTPEIAFTNAAGNFEDADRVVAQNIDGANTDDDFPGFPDFDHFNNANMTTYPDGTSPHMQMYLTVDFVDFNDGRSTALDASVVYHEYTHGLVGRTIVDAGGFQAVGGAQAGAINEGTADWYALDYLVGAGLETDGVGFDVLPGKYSFGDLRSEPMDCVVGSGSAPCDGAGTAGTGGYTYGDFGKVEGGPEVHGDGEIWAQTMWQLRKALIAAHGPTTGVEHVRQLFTNGMRLTPGNPSFLDLRNAILQADTAGALGDATTIWTVFSQRGMGYFASTRDSGDTHPVENFSLPPSPGAPKGTLSGTVTDADDLTPAVGVKVAFAGHDSGVGPELSGVTDGTGAYSIADVPTGTYPLVRVRGAGFESIELDNLVVATGTNTHDFALRRNLASASGGATISSFSGADNSIFGCGPSGLIDDSQAVVWGSSAPANTDDPGQKQITIALAAPSDVGTVEIDPGAGCGDDDTASLGAYDLLLSTDGTNFTTAATGAFKAIDNHRYNSVSIGGVHSGVTHVRLLAKGPQSSAGSGSVFMDVAEVRVFAGIPTAPDATTQAATAVGQSVATLNGVVNPQGTETDYQFEYGKTTSYGSKAPLTPVSVGNVAGSVPVQASLTNLLGNTTYHYRVVAIRGATRFNGLDMTFTTQPDTIRPVVGLSVPAQRLGAVRQNGFKVKVTRSEQGTLKLQLVVSSDTARKLGLGRTRVIGSLTKAVTHGTSTLTVKLSTKAKNALRNRNSVSFTVNATLTDAAHLKGTKSKAVTIRR